ncbi:uncharacterized protein K02A2.6-like [Coccinella septempunctata]|uniref:uncharacterized protein K02A2.6-like n=1 Tax=Coccinella septempunctata TaxID=41139 RepID=UPI001D08213A|nr:uncharacterized protein K02A2.6-like [Coccinella septempunctata]
MTTLSGIEQFQCEGDPLSLGSRWEKWKRALQIYLAASDIAEPAKKKAILLHSGGMALQEIFYSLPGADIDPTVDGNQVVDVFKLALQKLDEYFLPKQSKLFERYSFRLMKQADDEKFDKFLVRLRHQASKCHFSDMEEHLIDQITEKCKSKDLRRKILSLGDNIKLDDIILEANALESVNRQMQKFEDADKATPSTSDTINKLQIKNDFPSDLNNLKKQGCSRCGNLRHNSQDPRCPARDSTCTKCNFRGHFRKYCKSRRKRETLPQRSERKSKYSKQSNSINKLDSESEDPDYIFHLDDDTTIVCNVGGIMIPMIVDSGSKNNIIDEITWENLKQSGISIRKQVKGTDKQFISYASSKPLTVLGYFEAEIRANNKKENAKFYVIKNGKNNLLGKITATSLGILKIEVNVNCVTSAFPKIRGIVVDIPIDKNVQPVVQPYRRIPIPLEQKVDHILKDLLDKDIIEEVNEPSKWISPMVPVLKGNGDVRICIDMRRANQAISRENHPLPTMETLVPQLRRATLFSRLDIKNAFHQVEISESSRFITTFITRKGLFRYKRLMFGINCAPEIFQKIMEKILINCLGTINFIDDIIVSGEDENQHDENLKRTLDTLKNHDILLNNEKCQFKMSSVNFLGHVLSREGIKPSKTHIDAIRNFRDPKTIDELQSFLGLVNFVGKWIPNLATITEPLRELLRSKLGKNANIENHWKREQKEAFSKLKNALSSRSVLGYYDPQDRTQVIADASPVGLGAILLQFDSKGARVISYANKSLTDCERRYCQTEKEALALVWAVEHFKIYLFGKDYFELVTDHKPLEVIFGPKSKPCARIERWVLRLQSFKYRIVYRPGKTNIADPLSRLLVHNEKDQPFEKEFIHHLIEYTKPVAITIKELKKYTKSDKEIELIKAALKEGSWPEGTERFKIFENELSCYSEILLRGDKIVIPEKLRKRVLDLAHEGHPGIVAMKKRLRSKVWWPKIDNDAEKIVKDCKDCTLVSAPNPP